MADDKDKKDKKDAKPKGDAKPTGEGKSKGDAKPTAEGKSKGGAKPKGEGKSKGEAKPKAEGKKGKGKGKDAAQSAGPSIGEAEALTRVPRLREHFEKSVLPELMKRFSYSNPMEAPRLKKIVVNMGVGEALQNVKLLDTAANELATITGQKAAIRRAKKSIANFKLREGQPIGCMVTLRGARMYEFYDRLVNVALPRIRDFRGVLSKSFDGRGNYTLGLTEQIIFPEINYDRIDKIRGMDITFVTSARTDEEGQELLRLMNMPFRQR